MDNHYYDDNGIYTTSAPANEGSLPPAGAVREAPPSRPGYWPRRTAANDGWELAEDHRGERGWLAGVPAVMRELGPLPEGWSATPPLRAEDESCREKRRTAFMEQADPLRDEALTYWAEAQGWRLAGDEAQSRTALEKCTRLLVEYVAAKEAVRDAIPKEESGPNLADAEDAGDVGAVEDKTGDVPAAARLYLTASGTYHAPGCRYTAGAGEWLEPATLRSRRPTARACGLCRPGAV
ncbi:MAG: hypothetical protein LUE17_01430 [Planctomycetaceae bacterium]|nr:hypothetical protein [Planctomycetaceae bacterium]